MPLDKTKIITRYTKRNCRTELPVCGICAKRLTVAELLSEQFEAGKGQTGRLSYYHTTCLRMEAGGHD